MIVEIAASNYKEKKNSAMSIFVIPVKDSVELSFFFSLSKCAIMWYFFWHGKKLWLVLKKVTDIECTVSLKKQTKSMELPSFEEKMSSGGGVLACCHTAVDN